jgi:galactokinase
VITVSSAEPDRLVEAVQAAGAAGARLTGAGWRCIVA